VRSVRDRARRSLSVIERAARNEGAVNEQETSTRERRVARAWAATLAFVLTAPACAVGLVGLGLPGPAAMAGGCGLSVVAAWWAGRQMAGALATVLPRRPAALAALAIATLLLLAPYGRLAVFMADVTRPTQAFFKESPAWLYHSCFSAYIEADRLSQEPSRNIYDAAQYDNRTIDGFRVDTYYYPPPFLVQTRLVAALSGDFLSRRATWYAVQCLTLAAVALFICSWLGGRAGGLALLLLPLLYSAQPMLAGLQFGNIQVTAVTTATLGMLLIASARPAAGGALLALAAVSKIFPGLLGVYLLASRRWRGVSWTAAWSAAIVLAALWLVGTRPFVDFVEYALPRIHDLSAFPQAEAPRTVAVNLGVYGLAAKLRHLGVSWLDADAGRRITDLYGLVLIAITVALGWRDARRPWNVAREEDRTHALLTWLALAGLASYRSRFVGFAYGGASTMWLLWLMTASARRGVAVAAGVAGFALTAVLTSLVTPPAGGVPPTRVLVAALAVQVSMLAINTAVIVRAFRWRPNTSDDPATARSASWPSIPSLPSTDVSA
jgi:hypothetical protein